MQGFEQITLTWAGQSYVVPPNQQLMMIAKIEDALCGDSGQQALSILFRKEGPPYSRLAMAFGAALRHAGAKVTDDEIYLSIQSDMALKSKAEKTASVQAQILALLSILSPPMAKSLNSSEPSGDEKKD